MTHRGPFQPLLFCDSVNVKLAEGALSPITHIINKDIKQYQLQH